MSGFERCRTSAPDHTGLVRRGLGQGEAIMWKMIAALVTLAFVALFIIVKSGDPFSVPDKAGTQDGSASAMLAVPATAPVASVPASTPSAPAAGTGTAATASTPAEAPAPPAIKMSTRRTTVVGASAS